MRDDETLREDLSAAAGRDLPGEEFDRRVLASIEGGGGENVISVRHRRPRWKIFGLAAAVAMVALGLWAVGSGRIRREAPAVGGEVEVDLAKGIELPAAETSTSWPRPIRVAIKRDGTLRIEGRTVDHAGLLAELRKATVGTHDRALPAQPSRRDAVILADRRVRWREVQWAMQAFGDPSVRVYRLHFATAGPDGARRVLPAFLPIDRGLVDGIPLEEIIDEEVILEEKSDAPFQEGPEVRKVPVRKERPRIAVKLRRAKDETRTRYVLLDQELPDEAACLLRMTHILASNRRLPMQVDAGTEVPFEEVIRMIDAYRRTGRGPVTFIGAPPPDRK